MLLEDGVQHNVGNRNHSVFYSTCDKNLYGGWTLVTGGKLLLYLSNHINDISLNHTLRMNHGIL